MISQKSPNFMAWEAWVEKNRHLMQHPADFEAQFVLEVLSLVPEITTDHVIPQYEFIDSTNKKRRIDFVILDESRGLWLAIELDGLSKLEEKDTHSTNYRKFDDLLARQNDLLSKTRGRIFMLFRFSNKRWLNNPKSVARQITEELKEEYTAYQAMLKHNRFAQDVEKNLFQARQERDRLKQQLQKIQLELEAERGKGKINSDSDNSLEQEQARLSDAINIMARQYDDLNRQFERFQHEIVSAQNDLAKARQHRMKEQLEQEISCTIDSFQDKAQGGSNNLKNYLLVLSLVIIAVGVTACYMNSSKDILPYQPATQNQPAKTSTEVPPPVASQKTQAPVPKSYSTYEASAHIGATVTVCGILAEIKQLEGMTFLNFDEKYPNNIFTAAVADQHANQFLGVNKSLGHRICVNGKIRAYGKKSGIELQHKLQLER